MNEGTEWDREREETEARAKEKQKSDTQAILEEMRRDDISPRVKAMDIDAMTEEDARLAAIPLMEEYVEKNRGSARDSLIFTFVFGLIWMILFDDIAVDSDMTYANYRATKRALKKFRADTYKKSYKEFLRDWQNRILKAEEMEAKQAAARELREQKKAERVRIRAEKAEAKARQKAERRKW